jgi:hypothetical protein
MAIYRLIAKGSFGPEEIKAMTATYEAALLDLGLVDRDDPITEIVAMAISALRTGANAIRHSFKEPRARVECYWRS